MAALLRRTRLTRSEAGERAIGDRKFLGDVRRGLDPEPSGSSRPSSHHVSQSRPGAGDGGLGMIAHLLHIDSNTIYECPV